MAGQHTQMSRRATPIQTVSDLGCRLIPAWLSWLPSGPFPRSALRISDVKTCIRYRMALSLLARCHGSSPEKSRSSLPEWRLSLTLERSVLCQRRFPQYHGSTRTANERPDDSAAGYPSGDETEDTEPSSLPRIVRNSDDNENLLSGKPKCRFSVTDGKHAHVTSFHSHFLPCYLDRSWMYACMHQRGSFGHRLAQPCHRSPDSTRAGVTSDLQRAARR